LGGSLERESSASCVEDGKHIKKTFLIEHNDLNFKHKNESKPTGKEYVYPVGFYTISYS
jgi:hypothetical protein